MNGQGWGLPSSSGQPNAAATTPEIRTEIIGATATSTIPANVALTQTDDFCFALKDKPRRAPLPTLRSIIATARIPPAGRRRPAGPGADRDRRAAAKLRPPPPSSATVGAR